MIKNVHIHIEPATYPTLSLSTLTMDVSSIKKDITNAFYSYPDVRTIKELAVFYTSNQLVIQATIAMNPNLSLETAHEITEKVELKLHQTFSNIKQITIHTEPQEN
jgi:divalent metal cation (Fe/Co/Zn/Cd) transporter